MTLDTNQYGQPIGEAIAHWTARKSPEPVTLTGNYTLILPLDRTHISDLYTAYKNSHPSNWTYLPETPPESLAQFENDMLKKINADDFYFFAVLDKVNHKPLGYFSLMRVNPLHGVVEVGHVNFSDALKQSRISTEAQFLLATYVFDTLKYRRYEWKCDALNAPSMRAAKRLGFIYEGTFKQAVVYKNRSRDTSWFAMLNSDWPKHKSAMATWLAEENFDATGKQIHSLDYFR